MGPLDLRLREGGTLDLAGYLDEHRGLLLEPLTSTDLSHLGGDGFEILVLPPDSRLGWKSSGDSENLGIPRPKKQPDVVLSQTAENRTLQQLQHRKSLMGP